MRQEESWKRYLEDKSQAWECSSCGRISYFFPGIFPVHSFLSVLILMSERCKPFYITCIAPHFQVVLMIRPHFWKCVPNNHQTHSLVWIQIFVFGSIKKSIIKSRHVTWSRRMSRMLGRLISRYIWLLYTIPFVSYCFVM